jgi:hypothetical protein
MKIIGRKHLHIEILLIFTLLITFGCNFNFSVGVPKEPTSEDLQKLVKATIADFTEALEKDDFEGLRRKTSDAFQQKYKAEEIKTSFGNFATKKELSIPLFQEAQKTQAEFVQKPEMRKVGEEYVIETKGKFPTKSPDLNFHFEYVREDGKWKLVKFNIKT